MFGTTVDSTTSEYNGEDASADDDDEPMNLGSNILFAWELRNVKLDHYYSITRWNISVMPEVLPNVEECLTGVHRDAIEHDVSKLHKPPCPNKSRKIHGKTTGEILHMLWLEVKHFQKKMGPFDTAKMVDRICAHRQFSHMELVVFAILHGSVRFYCL